MNGIQSVDRGFSINIPELPPSQGVSVFSPGSAIQSDGVDFGSGNLLEGLFSAASKSNGGGSITCPQGTTPVVKEEGQTVTVECKPVKGKKESAQTGPSDTPILR